MIGMSLLMQKDHKPDEWDNIFFSEAVLWSRKSHDSQTQCGCVLVKNKTVIATGYNGFMREIDDSSLPSVRPEKYPFMIHAEANAIYNCAREGKSTLGATAYITAPPCTTCLQMLWQCGVHNIYFSDLSSPKGDIWTRRYNEILKQIGSRIDMRFYSKYNLDNSLLIESAEKFKKN
tara:strand:+ start:5487 stop:6014 length:528 start_codon:yes stop_codon:yes gene_type:complete